MARCFWCPISCPLTLATSWLTRPLREPTWHRRLRKKRSIDRRILRSRIPDSSARVRLAVKRLRTHHGSSIPTAFQVASAMPQWICGDCGYRNGTSLEWCGRCQVHYSQTSWKTHRPKNRPRTPQPRAQTSAKSKTTFPTFEEMNVAKQDPPWNKGTPARRVATPALNENEGKEATEAANAAQPVVPPQASLQEQLLKLQNDFKDQMTPDLRLAMEQFSKGMDNNGPQLTHAHLNRAKQARLALTKAKGKVTQLDAQWAQFLTVLKDNFKTQHASYQEKRGEALQQVAQEALDGMPRRHPESDAAWCSTSSRATRGTGCRQYGDHAAVGRSTVCGRREFGLGRGRVERCSNGTTPGVTGYDTFPMWRSASNQSASFESSEPSLNFSINDTMSTRAPFQGPAAGKIYGATDFRHAALMIGSTLLKCIERIEAFLKPIGPLLGCTDARLGTEQCFYEIEDVIYMVGFVSILTVAFLISIGVWWIAVYAFRLIQKNTAGNRIATHVKIQNIRYSVRGRWRPTRHYFMAGYIIALVTCSEANQFCREGHLADIGTSLSSSLGRSHTFHDLRERAPSLHDELPHFGPGEPVLEGFVGPFSVCWNGEQSSWQPKSCSIGVPYRPPFDFQDIDEMPVDDPRLPQPDLPMVTLMNFDRFDDQRLDVQRAMPSTEENPVLVNMVMFGNDGRPVGRRDSPLRTLTNEEIRTAVREARRDYPLATFQVFSVTPTPDRLRGQGWITVIDIVLPGLRHPPDVLALKETHVYRRSTAFLQELQQFEAFRFPSLTTIRGLIVAADLVDRCDTTRHGHCSVLHRGQVLLLGVQHRIQGGDHLCFLVDEAQPPPTEVITFNQAHSFVQTIQTALYHAGPRQYLTILLHGFRGNTLGTRIYGAHRQRVEDLDVFAGDIMSLWHEENFEQVEVTGVHPQLLLQDSDGAINLHFLVFFSPPVRPAVLLHRPAEEGYGEFCGGPWVLELCPFGWLLSLACQVSCRASGWPSPTTSRSHWDWACHVHQHWGTRLGWRYVYHAPNPHTDLDSSW